MVCLKLVAMVDGDEIGCEDLVAEDQPACECANCVREVKFEYTGLGCSQDFFASGKCTDRGPNPFVAEYVISSCDGSTQVFASGTTQQGDIISIGATEGVCLPACMSVAISVPSGGVTQSFEIDSTCDGSRELVLTSDYGAFKSIGYSCSDTDTHNCIQEIEYSLSVCNIGSTDEQIYECLLTLDDDEFDILQGVTPADTMLQPGNCFSDTFQTEVDRCNGLDSCPEIFASATNPITGLPQDCSDTDEIKFGWDQPGTLPPTPQPR